MFKKINDELNFMQQKYALERELEDLFLKEGFSPVETSFFEDYESFSSINKKFKKESLVKILNGYGDIMIVRPDVTSNLIKRYIPRFKEGLKLKLFYNATVFSNKIGFNIHEHKQLGIEYLGEKSEQANHEVIRLALNILNRYNKDFILEVGNSKFLSSLLEKLNLSETDEAYLSQLYNQKNKYELEQFIENQNFDSNEKLLLKSITNLQGELYNLDSLIKQLNQFEINEQMRESIDELFALKTYIKEQGEDLLKHIYVDLTMVPRFDYYEGIVFKGLFKQVNEPILTGGRYDALTSYYGKKVPAMGFSIDLDELMKSVYKGDQDYE
ncbi:ATP phosphoribosyltransferase regulatory subunit [Haloplasma contractile]|uniref:ATP phosphoribosyltransferase regulatory subunit protein n=1 Tax=Haloplasma contractile SSD-17B TaxID=1033810 RepID=U2DU05_9MOLU|nr:ATP phosphoribosyltransferase regulatory subunit [Haloplasma contractile]ERJ11932.1 ATP phosphoribosyltransferase regulatory subunit protein [Haloplasma contractile SSD-17B]